MKKQLAQNHLDLIADRSELEHVSNRRGQGMMRELKRRATRRQRAEGKREIREF